MPVILNVISALWPWSAHWKCPEWQSMAKHDTTNLYTVKFQLEQGNFQEKDVARYSQWVVTFCEMTSALENPGEPQSALSILKF